MFQLCELSQGGERIFDFLHVVEDERHQVGTVQQELQLLKALTMSQSGEVQHREVG